MQKKLLFIIIILFTMLLIITIVIIGLGFYYLDAKYGLDNDDYKLIKQRTNTDFSNCSRITSKRDVGKGDHDFYIVLNCNECYKSIEKSMKNWNKCPMDKLLNYEFYFHEKTISEKYDVPLINNCLYKFYSTGSTYKNNGFPDNYVIALYNVDTHYLYFVDYSI